MTVMMMSAMAAAMTPISPSLSGQSPQSAVPWSLVHVVSGSQPPLFTSQGSVEGDGGAGGGDAALLDSGDVPSLGSISLSS